MELSLVVYDALMTIIVNDGWVSFFYPFDTLILIGFWWLIDEQLDEWFGK